MAGPVCERPPQACRSGVKGRAVFLRRACRRLGERPRLLVRVDLERVRTAAQPRSLVAVSDVADMGTLYVATTGQPYPVELRAPGGQGGQIVFYRFNESVSPTAPAHSIDISQLRHNIKFPRDRWDGPGACTEGFRCCGCSSA